jgi:hypothetical protein
MNFEAKNAFIQRAQAALDFSGKQLRRLIIQHPDHFPLYTVKGKWRHDSEAWTNWCDWVDVVFNPSTDSSNPQKTTQNAEATSHCGLESFIARRRKGQETSPPGLFPISAKIITPDPLLCHIGGKRK